MSDDKLNIWQALRIIAERTPFQTEEQGRAVLAAIDEHAADDEGEVPTAASLVEDEPEDERDVKLRELESELARLRGSRSADPSPAEPASTERREATFNPDRETPESGLRDAKQSSTPAKKTTSSVRNGRRA